MKLILIRHFVAEGNLRHAYIGRTDDPLADCPENERLRQKEYPQDVYKRQGVMNTHSRQADCRMEVLASHGAMAGLGQEQVKKIMNCITTTEALEILREAGVLEDVMVSVMGKMEQALIHRAGKQLKLGVIMFSEGEILGKAGKVTEILEEIKREEKLTGKEESR